MQARPEPTKSKATQLDTLSLCLTRTHTYTDIYTYACSNGTFNALSFCLLWLLYFTFFYYFNACALYFLLKSLTQLTVITRPPSSSASTSSLLVTQFIRKAFSVKERHTDTHTQHSHSDKQQQKATGREHEKRIKNTTTKNYVSIWKKAHAEKRAEMRSSSSPKK